MKKCICLLLGLLFLLIIGGCTSKIDDVVCERQITIDPKEALDSILFSEVFEKISYTKITTDDNFLVGRIDKLVISDEYIFILDRDLSRSVFCIDKSGNKVFEIHRLGKGPGEYVDLRDIAYDFRQKELLLFCGVRQRVIWFDLQGNYLREKKIPFWIVGIQSLQDKGLALFCDYNPENKLKKDNYYPNVIVVDSNMNVLTQNAYFDVIVDKGVVWSSRPDFSCLGNTVGIMPDHSNTIYHIENNNITSWKVDFGKYNINEEYWEQAANKKMSLKQLEEYCRVQGICKCIYYMENEKIIYFAYRYKGNHYHVFYSKETGRLIQTKKLVNDMNRFGKFSPKNLDRTQFYSYVSAGMVYDSRDKLKESKAMPEDILQTIEMSDNPILVSYTIKNF